MHTMIFLETRVMEKVLLSSLLLLSATTLSAAPMKEVDEEADDFEPSFLGENERSARFIFFNASSVQNATTAALLGGAALFLGLNAAVGLKLLADAKQSNYEYDDYDVRYGGGRRKAR